MKKQFVSDTITTPSEPARPECVRHPRCKNQWLDRGAGGNSTLTVISIPPKITMTITCRIRTDVIRTCNIKNKIKTQNITYMTKTPEVD